MFAARNSTKLRSVFGGKKSVNVGKGEEKLIDEKTLKLLVSQHARPSVKKTRKSVKRSRIFEDYAPRKRKTKKRPRKSRKKNLRKSANSGEKEHV